MTELKTLAEIWEEADRRPISVVKKYALKRLNL
jgi:hypothetical protein